MPACHRIALSNIYQLSPHPSRKSPPTEERVPAPLRWSPYCLDYPLLDNVQNNRGQLCVVVTSLTARRRWSPYRKFPALGGSGMSVCISPGSFFSGSSFPVIRSVIRVRVYRFSSFLLFAAILAASLVLEGCGSSAPNTTTTTTTTTTPPPNNPPPPPAPSTPPVPITWTPQTSPLPAPPAEVPPPTASNDFPLTISSPSDGATVTSPATVVASANPKNPIFFMRVYVDQLAVYFTFSNSINTLIWMSPGKHTLEVMAEDKQGYISATPLQIN